MQGRHKGRGGGGFFPQAPRRWGRILPRIVNLFFLGGGGGVEGAWRVPFTPGANPGRDDPACMYEEYILN